MLAPASKYKKELSEIWSQKVLDPNFKYWQADLYYDPNSEIRNTSYRKDDWVCLEDGKVVGYICAVIDKNTRSVEDITTANFVPNNKYTSDMLKFIRILKRKYHYIRWAAVEGHPSEKAYEKIAKFFGGRVVGTFKNKIKLLDGKLYNERWYEIENTYKGK